MIAVDWQWNAREDITITINYHNYNKSTIIDLVTVCSPVWTKYMFHVWNHPLTHMNPFFYISKHHIAIEIKNPSFLASPPSPSNPSTMTISTSLGSFLWLMRISDTSTLTKDSRQYRRAILPLRMGYHLIPMGLCPVVGTNSPFKMVSSWELQNSQSRSSMIFLNGEVRSRAMILPW